MFFLLVYKSSSDPKRPYRPGNPDTPFPRPEWNFEDDEEEWRECMNASNLEVIRCILLNYGLTILQL